MRARLGAASSSHAGLPFVTPAPGKRRVLVTGGAGYVGSCLVRRLLGEGHAVRALDLMIYGDSALAGVAGHSGLEIIQADIRDDASLRRALAGVDAVAHLAAIVGDPACALRPDLATSTNLDATGLLADLCLQVGVPHVVFASTCSVYGAGESDLTEESPVSPVSLYAQTKVQAERVLLDRAVAGLDPVVLRFATIYGIAPRLRFDLVANLLMARAVRNGEITIYGGEQRRPFLHVVDAARAVILALDVPGGGNHRIFNVGSSKENYQLRRLGRLIAELTPGTRLAVDRSTHDPRTYHVRFDRFVDATGFQPSRTLRQGLTELRDVLNAHPEIDVGDPRWDNAGFLSNWLDPHCTGST